MEKTITMEHRNVEDLGDRRIDHQSVEYDLYVGIVFINIGDYTNEYY